MSCFTQTAFRAVANDSIADLLGGGKSSAHDGALGTAAGLDDDAFASLGVPLAHKKKLGPCL